MNEISGKGSTVSSAIRQNITIQLKYLIYFNLKVLTFAVSCINPDNRKGSVAGIFVYWQRILHEKVETNTRSVVRRHVKKIETSILANFRDLQVFVVVTSN